MEFTLAFDQHYFPQIHHVIHFKVLFASFDLNVLQNEWMTKVERITHENIGTYRTHHTNISANCLDRFAKYYTAKIARTV